MEDLVKRLRLPGMPPLYGEAAAEIERLRAALAVARSALTAETIGTIYMDEPTWYKQVDEAVTAIDAVLSYEQHRDT